MKLFHESYPTDPLEKEGFPHTPTDVTQQILTTKLKNIRGKYRASVDSGRQIGHGRVVWMYFDECESIWGGSPATTSFESGIESSDLTEEEGWQSSSACGTSQASSDDESEPDTESPSSVVTETDDKPCASTSGSGSACGNSNKNAKARRALLDEKLKNYKQDKLKRKVSLNSQLLHCAQEELQTKKQLLEKIDAMDKQYADSMKVLSSNIEKLTNCITAVFTDPQYHMMPPAPHMPTAPHLSPAPHMPHNGSHYQGMGYHPQQQHDYSNQSMPSFSQQLGFDNDQSQY